MEGMSRERESFPHYNVAIMKSSERTDGGRVDDLTNLEMDVIALEIELGATPMPLEPRSLSLLVCEQRCSSGDRGCMVPSKGK